MSSTKSREVRWMEETSAILLSEFREGGLRRAIALLEREPKQLDVALWVLEALVSEMRQVGLEGEALAVAFCRRSDLPAALACTHFAALCGRDAATVFPRLAKLFGRGSDRLSPETPIPPPLPPAEANVSEELEKLEGEPLWERAEVVLRQVIERLKDDGELELEGFKVHPSALFSALSPEALEQLLRVMVLRNLAKDEVAIEQGQEGHEAFVVVRGRLRAERAQEPGQALAILGRRTIFGEMALVSDAPRAATVIAEEPTILLVMAREALERIAEQDSAVGRELAGFGRARMMANLMRRGSVLNAVPEAQRNELIARFEAKSFQPGEVLVVIDEQPPGLYLIASGGVGVTGVDSDGDALRLAELGPGDVVGEIGLVLRRPATATCTAIHPTLTLFLAQESFATTIREHPALLNELYEIAIKRDEENRQALSAQALDVDNLVLI